MQESLSSGRLKCIWLSNFSSPANIACRLFAQKLQGPNQNTSPQTHRRRTSVRCFRHDFELCVGWFWGTLGLIIMTSEFSNLCIK